MATEVVVIVVVAVVVILKVVISLATSSELELLCINTCSFLFSQTYIQYSPLSFTFSLSVSL